MDRSVKITMRFVVISLLMSMQLCASAISEDYGRLSLSPGEQFPFDRLIIRTIEILGEDYIYEIRRSDKC